MPFLVRIGREVPFPCKCKTIGNFRRIFNSDSESSVFCNSYSNLSEIELADRNVSPGPVVGTGNTMDKRQRRSTKKTLNSAKKTKKNTNEQTGNDLEASLSQLIRANLKCNEDIDKNQKSSGAEIAALATNFRQTADALGGRVQAALAFDKFKMFLNNAEKRELQELKEDQED